MSGLIISTLDPPGMPLPTTHPVWYRCGHVYHYRGKLLPTGIFPKTDCPWCRGRKP
jgi:hypothetical protein